MSLGGGFNEATMENGFLGYLGFQVISNIFRIFIPGKMIQVYFSNGLVKNQQLNLGVRPMASHGGVSLRS